MTTITTKYLCTSCHHEWTGALLALECPNCGSKDIKPLTVGDRKTRSVTHWTGSGDDFYPFLDFIETMKDVYESIPQEYRGAARIDIDSDYDSSTVNLVVHYERPETDGEMKHRIEREKKFKEDEEKSERETLKRLLAKYGSKV